MGLNIIEPIDDATADLEVPRPLAKPPPALERAGAELPAAGQFDLVKVCDSHFQAPRGEVQRSEE